MPVILKERELLELTRECVSHLRTVHSASLYVVCNALHLCSVDELHADLQSRFNGPVAVLNEPGVVRSVAGSWNASAAQAFADGAEYIAAIANDAILREDCLDLMVAYGERGQADLWSGISYNNRAEIVATDETDGADFTCFMFTRSTIQKHGWFDPNFKPAYFEDNDYYARVVLGGGNCRILHSAQFYHHGSMTIRHDPDAAYHVRHWFELNRAYFGRKWGVPQPAASRDAVLKSYFQHPFNDPERPLCWFPENGNPRENTKYPALWFPV
jgi:GT2 family glycosyltransferase